VANYPTAYLHSNRKTVMENEQTKQQKQKRQQKNEEEEEE
jgi:hypothetical protein